ncbi:asparagine synthase-related protein [Winogradskyella psychrotolerans]|uniref:asparagine synthase-related protein n=1 Tax=Winogradskyella psychrotolerans TaxID=1344585 RepID=UPI001C06C52D|nr:asparagine synthase-related protein [Winogradskyella psychrotolerans]MBU2929550.1 asparagine synthetase B family protein [Winogradskyella psychrotolerans]
MKTIKTPIIPLKQTIVKVEGVHEPNYKAICIFAAIGFFLDEDTYWKDEKVLKPRSTYNFDVKGNIIKHNEYFNWYHRPRNISFKTAVDEFTDLFEFVIKEQSANHRVLLPLSGGIDSRTQAVALKQLGADVHSYSYRFKNGFKEDVIGKKIAEACDFKFDSLVIPPNYLWNVIEKMGDINHCYSEFTHPRQMAVLDEFSRMNGQFSLGHWGDVLFDSGIAEAYSSLSDVEIIYKKVVKKGGIALATQLWKSWGLEGDFESYFKQRIQNLLNEIDIRDKSARIRAFKSLYWAPRWTSVSLSFFEVAHPIHLPYYDDRICRFICEIPEAYLADRRIQIEYIKNRNPKLAAIAWQDHMPFNLYTYKNPKLLKSIVYRAKNKLEREINSLMGMPFIQRNWELQFLGQSNSNQLENYVFDSQFNAFIGSDVVPTIYNAFKNKDAVFYSHAVSMLLTLALWLKKNKQP